MIGLLSIAVATGDTIVPTANCTELSPPALAEDLTDAVCPSETGSYRIDIAPKSSLLAVGL
jgi:hypothetical protein